MMMKSLLIIVVAVLLVVSTIQLPPSVVEAASTPNISDVILALQRVESAKSWPSWKYLLTSIRKLAYDSSFWNLILSEGATTPRLTASGNITAADVQLLGSHRVSVSTLSSTMTATTATTIDLSHVFVGFECVVSPSYASSLTLLGLNARTRLATATWGGDVASAATDLNWDKTKKNNVLRFGCNSSSSFSAQLSCYLKALAGDDDLEADLHGINLGYQNNNNNINNPNVTLSQMLSDYFLVPKTNNNNNSMTTSSHFCMATLASKFLKWSWSPSSQQLSTSSRTEITTDVGVIADVLHKRLAGCPSSPFACFSSCSCASTSSLAASFWISWLEKRRDEELKTPGLCVPLTTSTAMTTSTTTTTTTTATPIPVTSTSSTSTATSTSMSSPTTTISTTTTTTTKAETSAQTSSSTSAAVTSSPASSTTTTTTTPLSSASTSSAIVESSSTLTSSPSSTAATVQTVPTTISSKSSSSSSSSAEDSNSKNTTHPADNKNDLVIPLSAAAAAALVVVVAIASYFFLKRSKTRHADDESQQEATTRYFEFDNNKKALQEGNSGAAEKIENLDV